MKKNIKKILLPFLLMSTVVSRAQTGMDSTARKDHKAQFKMGIYYNSGLNYYGRTDSLRSSGIFPMAELWFSPHLYITAAPVFVMNKENSFNYAGAVAVAGYRFGEEDHSAGNIYLVKPLYKKNSQLVQSSLDAQLVASGSWLNKFINVTLGADVKFSDKIDYGASAGLDHIIRLELGTSVLVLDPAATVNAGTQQFTKTYYKQSSFLLFPRVQQQVTEEVSSFKILSYEFSRPGSMGERENSSFILKPLHMLFPTKPWVTGYPARPRSLPERGKKNMFPMQPIRG